MILNKDQYFYTTRPFESSQICRIIRDCCLRDLETNPKYLIITDGTAHIGGDAINLSKLFNQVNAIEILKQNYDILNKNIETYNINNISTFNSDYTKIYNTISQDVIYIDSPWVNSKSELKTFKKQNFVELYLSGIRLEDLVYQLKNHFQLLFIKAPKNFYLITTLNTTIYKIYNQFHIHCYNLIKVSFLKT